MYCSCGDFSNCHLRILYIISNIIVFSILWFMKTATSPFSKPQEFENVELFIFFIYRNWSWVCQIGIQCTKSYTFFNLSFIKNLCSSNYNFKKCTVFKSVHCYLDVKTTYIHVCVQIHKSHHKKRRNTYPLFPLAASQQNF